MQAEFYLRREQNNTLECGRYRDKGVGMHFHSQIEIHLILSGEQEVWVNDRHCILGPGEMSAAFSYDAHSYRSLRETESMSLIIPTDLCGEFRPLFAGRHTGDPFLREPADVETVRRAIETIIAGANDLIVRGCIYTVLGTLYDRMSFASAPRTGDPHDAAQFLIYINEHFREEITLSSMAAAFSYNPSYLSRSFKETFGIGFNRYVTMLRLREAALLLRAGEKSVTSCALESGFRSLRSFYRSFYEEFGCTPREYPTENRHL